MLKPLNIWYCHTAACAPSTGNQNPNRAYYLSLEWRKLGHKPTVITSSYEHWCGEKASFDPPFYIEEADKVSFAYLKTLRYQGNGIKRILSMLSYAWKLHQNYKKIMKRIGSPDAIICSMQHPFHFNVCRKIARKYDAKLVSEIRDLWPLSLIEILRVSKWHPFCLWLAKIEKQVCKHSDQVISVLPNADEYLKTKGLAPSKFHVISNGYAVSTTGDNVDVENDEDYLALKSLKNKGKFVIGYTGAHGEPNHLRILCEAIRQLNDQNIHVVFIGEGNIRSQLINEFSNVAQIHFFEKKPKSMISKFIELFDIGYCALPISKVCIYGHSMNKVFEYMALSIPILTGSTPEASPEINAGCALYFKNDSIEDLKRIIFRISKMDLNTLKCMGKKGQYKVNDKYLYSQLAKKYASIFMYDNRS